MAKETKTRREFIAGGAMAAAGAALAWPTRSNVGGNMISFAGKTDAKIDLPYVTDGLAAFWDGEWNAGYGSFDPEASVWMDLSGNRRHLASRGSPDWRIEDGMYGAYMNTGVNCFGNLNSKWFRDMWESERGVYVEVVAKGAYNSVVFGFGGEAEVEWSYGINVYNVNSEYQFCFIKGRIREPFASVYLKTPYRIWLWQNRDTFAFSANGSQTISGSYEYSNDGKNGLGIGCRGDQYGNRSILGMISRVAVYDRLLSDEEIAFNASIDNERFGT